MEPELEPFGYDSLSESTPLRRTGFKRARINWVDVSNWNPDQIPEPAVQTEISRIMSVPWPMRKLKLPLYQMGKLLRIFD